MPPKKKEAKVGANGAKRPVGRPPKAKTDKSENDKSRGKLSEKNRGSDRAKGVNGDDDEGPSQQSSQIFRRKNWLNDFLSTSQGHDDSRVEDRKGTSHSFEEDEGFVYKRSQTDLRKKKQISTPIAQLNEEIGNLTRDADQEMQFVDLQPIRSKPHNFLDESSLQLSSPIKTRQFESSDEYVEQVSHHKVSLRPEKRRTSYYNRGKRVSSIGNGFVGEPHRDVSVQDYYKLLDTALPEPDRMRQLLIWCLKKKLEEEVPQSSEDQTVVNIAKVIKEEILGDLMDKQISTSWYSLSREPAADLGEVTIPNPINVTNLENIEIYTQKLHSLAKEKQLWHASYKKCIEPIKQLGIDIERGDINKYVEGRGQMKNLLDESLIKKMESTKEEIHTRISTGVESSVDRLFHASYQMDKTKQVVQTLESKFHDKVSALLKDYMTKTRINKYDRLRRHGNQRWPLPSKSIGTRELLRSLSRVSKPKS